jgi:twitching motility protein PilT
MEFDSLLAEMTRRKASDLHLAVSVPPIFRVDGDLIPAPPPNLTPEDLDALLQTMLPEDKLSGARQGRDFSATLRHDEQTFRCQVFRERGHLAAAIRVVPERIYTLEEMHLLPIFETLTRARRGLILVAGPTGSGKTTTLVSMLEQINLTRSERIYTLEDPLNYVLRSKLSLITQRVVGEDVESYAKGLLSIRDADPDIVLVGELRTPETARLALEMAEAGVLVFSQMTADTVAEAVARLLEMLGEPRDSARRLLARTMQAVIAQKLLVRADRPGRVAANEILLSTPRIRQMIADGQTGAGLLSLAMEASSPMGMQTMDDALLALRADGVISRETAASHLTDKTRLPSG